MHRTVQRGPCASAVATLFAWKRGAACLACSSSRRPEYEMPKRHSVFGGGGEASSLSRPTRDRVSG
jgi:hypothetical protein